MVRIVVLTVAFFAAAILPAPADVGATGETALQPGVRLTLTASDAGAGGECVTDATGYCGIPKGFGSLVILIEDVSTLPAGYALGTIGRGGIVDAKTIMPLDHANTHRRFE